MKIFDDNDATIYGCVSIRHNTRKKQITPPTNINDTPTSRDDTSLGDHLIILEVDSSTGDTTTSIPNSYVII